jgi:hypothetical protein
VGRAVVGDDAGPVEDEDDRQVHQADIVIDLVVGPLEEGRVDGHDRLEAGEGQARGEAHGMLLGDADVEEAVGQLLGELPQARALAHGRGDGQDLRFAPGDLDHGLAEGARIGRAPVLAERLAGEDLERPRAVELLRVEAGRRIAPAFLGHALDEDGPLKGLGRFEGLDERLDVVAVDRADVADAELLEDEPGEEGLLDQLLQGPAGLYGRLAELRDAPEDGLGLVLDLDIPLT